MPVEMAAPVNRRGRMVSSDDKCIRRHFLYLKQEIRATDLLDSLISTMTITVEQAADIRRQPDQNHGLLEVLLHGGPLAFPGLLAALEASGYPHVAKRLKNSQQENKDEVPDGMFQNAYKHIKEATETITGIQQKIGKNEVNDGPVGILKGLVAEVHSYEEDLENKKGEIEFLKEENRRKDLVLCDLKRDLSTKEEQLHKNQLLVESLSRKVSDLEETCSQQRHGMARLTKQVVCSDNVIEKQKVSLGEYRQELEAQKDTVLKLQTEIHVQSTLIGSMKKEMKTLGKRVEEMELANNEQKLMIGKQREHIAQRHEDIQKLTQRSHQVDALESNVSSLRNDLTQKDLTINHHRTELIRLREEHDKEVQRNAYNMQDVQDKLTRLEKEGVRQSTELHSQWNCMKEQVETVQQVVNRADSLRNQEECRRNNVNQEKSGNSKLWRY